MRGAAVLSLLYLTTVPKEGKMFLFLKNQNTFVKPVTLFCCVLIDPSKQQYSKAAETTIKHG
jgi:hypothetical protein